MAIGGHSEAVALLLGLVGAYISWRTVRTYLSNVFHWIGNRRANWASLFFVAGSVAYAWFGYLAPSETPLTTNVLLQVVSYIAFLAIFPVFAIPPGPVESSGTQKGGPTFATLAFIVLLFIEAQLIYFFALPLTIP